MKQLTLLLFTLVLGITSQAQTATLLSQYGNTVDTVQNTGTKYMKTLKLPGNGYPKIAEVAITITEIDGTTGGTLSMEASLDGSNWYSFYGSRDSTYTFTPLDQAAAQTFRFHLPPHSDQYYRVKYTGTGTMRAKIQAFAVISRAE